MLEPTPFRFFLDFWFYCNLIFQQGIFFLDAKSFSFFFDIVARFLDVFAHISDGLTEIIFPLLNFSA